MFRLLKLTPPHGWNAVGWELGIVTLGVLIALGAQQVAEALHDRSIAAETRADITDELNSDLMSMVLRQAAEPCIDRRLSDVRGIVIQWERTGSFVTPSWVSQSPVIEIELSRYDAALSAGRLALLSGDEQYRMGAVVGRIRKYDEWQMAERVPWGRLRALQFGADALSAGDRAAIRSALQDAATFNYEAKLNIAQALPMARRYGFRPDEKGFREMAPQVWPGGKFTPSICAAIDTPPAEANKRVIIPLAQ
ncbi:hypothetical protein [Sphingomonas sp. URHD0057]|uniref:hypothetical protein n=1 Tax=Sphingomonas sp. URHD0057 TaxID=1380389 RepID=UPI000A44350F|nr:hypothetical protein [Sphingomonas sp. URHD0057]